MVKALRPLVMMQLKDKMDLSYLKSTKQTIAKVVLSVLAFVLITAVIFLLLFFGKFLKIIYIKGEVSNARIYKGHLYFVLKDDCFGFIFIVGS